MTDKELDPDVNAILARATQAQLRWVTARLHVDTQQEACRIAGVHRSTVARWPNRDELELAIRLLLRDVAKAVAFELQQAAPDAVRALRESLDDPRSRLAAAVAILDRVGFAPRQRHEVVGMADEPLIVKFIREGDVAREGD